MIWYSSSWVESSFANAWVSSPNLSNETIQCLDKIAMLETLTYIQRFLSIMYFNKLEDYLVLPWDLEDLLDIVRLDLKRNVMKYF